MGVRRLLAAGIAALTITGAGVLTPGVAHAEYAISEGARINIVESSGTKECSVGFFAKDSDGDYYIVTAAHCADHRDVEVQDGADNRIGRVIASKGKDFGSEDGGDDFGATLILLDKGTGLTLKSRFTGARKPVVGDRVSFNGASSDQDFGPAPISELKDYETYARRGFEVQGLESIPGDSGAGIWATDGQLVGMVIGHGDRVLYGQSIDGALEAAHAMGFDLTVVRRPT